MQRLFAIALLTMLWSGVSLADDTHYQLQVDGLACPFCAYNIEKSVGKLEGVKDVKANLKEGLVSVLVVNGKTLNREVVRQTITDAGFTLRSIDSHPAGR